MARFTVTNQAQEDLTEIVGYIAKRNRSAAKKVLGEFRQAMRELASFPGMGHTRSDLTEEPVRFWAVYSYLIVYRPESSPLEVVAVFHGARDFSSALKRRLRR